MKIAKFLTLPLALVAFAILAGCGSSYVYEKKYQFDTSGWTYADTLDFEISIQDTFKIYDLFLEIEHSRDYPYQNLYAIFYTTFPDQTRLKKQISLEIGESNGKWLGNCSGNNCTLVIPIQKNAYFNQSGNYLFTLEQFMRVDSIQQINHITFKVKDTGKARNE